MCGVSPLFRFILSSIGHLVLGCPGLFLEVIGISFQGRRRYVVLHAGLKDFPGRPKTKILDAHYFGHFILLGWGAEPKPRARLTNRYLGGAWNLEGGGEADLSVTPVGGEETDLVVQYCYSPKSEDRAVSAQF
jgi:hypothetical protein